MDHRSVGGEARSAGLALGACDFNLAYPGLKLYVAEENI